MNSVNPYTGELLCEWKEDTWAQIEEKLALSVSFQSNREDFGTKALRLAALLRKSKMELAALITREMGKPILQSLTEVEKCAWCCEYYAEHYASFLQDKEIKSDASRSFVRYERMGTWLAVMPWNFPFWQVFRCAIPALAAGNNMVLKHASNVQGCAKRMEELFATAGFHPAEFQVLVLSGHKMSDVIRHPVVKGVSVTGSTDAGTAVASVAAAAIKPQVLELGGSNALIITEDADIEKACEDVITGRFQNNGQSCIAAKRLLVHRSIADKVQEELVRRINALNCGDPMTESTYIGPLAKKEFNDELMRQLQSGITQGAKVLTGGKISDRVFEPALLSEVTPAMTCMQEELFGPVLPVYAYSDWEEAVAVSNSTPFGLGVSIYTRNVEAMLPHVSSFHEGAVFINHIVKSDPRLPFGGVKLSGFGRELGTEGLRAFTNVKTVFIR